MAVSAKPTLEGFLNVAKPSGWTSHDVVGLVRRLTQTRRVGHGGTLDPAATGVLPVAVGKSTRLIDYIADKDKTYRADVVLGASTATDDAEGAVIRTGDPSFIELEDLAAALSSFAGEIEQVPPQYSAVKLQGRKAYDIARKGGQAPLVARRVTVRGIAIVDWRPPILRMIVRCSKGTYIRSLARDLGNKLGVGAYLGGLVRLASGPFDIADAITIEDLRQAAESGDLAELLLPADAAVMHLPALTLPGEVASYMALGRSWEDANEHPAGTISRVYSEKGVFLGLAELSDNRWRPKVVLSGAN